VDRRRGRSRSDLEIGGAERGAIELRLDAIAVTGLEAVAIARDVVDGARELILVALLDRRAEER
jgi:hypothetical protein